MQLSPNYCLVFLLSVLACFLILINQKHLVNDSQGEIKNIRSAKRIDRLADRRPRVALVDFDEPIHGSEPHIPMIINDQEFVHLARRELPRAVVSQIDPRNYQTSHGMMQELEQLDVAVVVVSSNLFIASAMSPKSTLLALCRPGAEHIDKAIIDAISLMMKELSNDTNITPLGCDTENQISTTENAFLSFREGDLKNHYTDTASGMWMNARSVLDSVKDALDQLNLDYISLSLPQKSSQRKKEKQHVGFCICGQPRAFSSIEVAKTLRSEFIVKMLQSDDYDYEPHIMLYLSVGEDYFGNNFTIVDLEEAIRELKPDSVKVHPSFLNEQYNVSFFTGQIGLIPFKYCYQELIKLGEKKGVKKFDWLVRLRPDLVGGPDDPNLLETLSPEKIHVRRYHSKDLIYSGYGASDHWAVMPGSAGPTYFNVIDGNPLIGEQDLKCPRVDNVTTSMYGPECVLYNHVTKLGWGVQHDLQGFFPGHWFNIGKRLHTPQRS